MTNRTAERSALLRGFQLHRLNSAPASLAGDLRLRWINFGAPQRVAERKRIEQPDTEHANREQ